MVLNIEHLYKYFGGEPILKDICLTVEDKETIGLIGVNGCGKSTLLNIITGELDFDLTEDGKGSLSIDPRVKIGYLKQNSGLDSTLTIRDEMKNALSDLTETLKRMKELEQTMGDKSGDELKALSDEYASLSAFFEARDGYRMNTKIDMILNGMGFSPDDSDRLISTLSGGEKTRLALAKLLLEEPQLLILDEPTNHLDFMTLKWLEDHLKTYKGSVLIVSHDRYFLDKVCTRICEIENCRLTSYKGGYSQYVAAKKANVIRQEKEYEAQQTEIKKLEEYIAKNKVRASTAKMAKSRQAMLDRIDRIDKPLSMTKAPKIKLEYDIEPTKEAIKLTGCDLTVGFGTDSKTISQSLDLLIRRGEHTGLIGINGAGKTSILKLIMGIIPHEKGSVVFGGNVKLFYFDQEHASLDPSKTALDELLYRFNGLSPETARKVLASVLIQGDDVFKPISILSGGERAKVCFAIMILSKANVLILDEPTNHLDLAAKEVLEEALAEYTGTMLLVSHDRYLLNRTVNRIVELKNGELRSFEGNFTAYSDIISAEQQQLALSESERKAALQEQAKKESKQKLYRSKEQRALDAKKRARIKELEALIENAEEQIAVLEEEIASPEVTKDYEKLNAKCAELESLRTQLDGNMEEWATLSDEL